ncbi:MAG: Cys-tRNA(Pro) deacylase [Propionibacteriaceae bacterium]|jgi:Cys-tRNA(Pro)/Cys-tRNA(Cys) deacylase|nr:Cys-tRNA(Pro) deacylase [Propionibacteriaceae bacterium]
MSATPATVVLDSAGIPYELHPYDHDPANHNFGDEAAASLGVDPLQIFKTLVVDTGGRHLAVAVVPVATQLDLKAMATVLGVKKADLADPELAVRSSGYIVGGISPIGQKTPLTTIIDETAELFDTIFVSAGRRGLQISLFPQSLATITSARFADIAR